MNILTNTIEEFVGEFRWLSNFYHCRIPYQGITYPSVEHAYQAAKFTNESTKEDISLLSAGQAKRFGQKKPIETDNWDSVKEGVMQELLEIKFSIPSLAERLIALQGVHIQEGNRWGDEFWGINLKTHRGNNRLGKIIMNIRDRKIEET